MFEKRKKVEELFLLRTKKAGSMVTYKIMKEFFATLKDSEFTTLMKNLRDNKEVLSFIIPHSEATKIDEHNIINLLDGLGVKLEQHLTIKSEEYGNYTTPIKFLLLDLPFKRASQTLDKKVSIPKGSTTSLLTGGVSGDAQSSKITMPETMIQSGFNLEKTISELFVPRGGDLGAGNAMDKYLYTTGKVSLKDVKMFSTGNVSTRTLKSYLSASHIESTL